MISTFSAKLVEKIQLSADVFSVTFTYTDSPLVFLPGQYIIAHIPSGTNSVRRLYSIDTSPEQTESFSLLVRHVPNGIGSSYLHALPLGSEVTFQGPAGLFTLKETDRPKIYLATGTGITPFLSILRNQLLHPLVPSVPQTLLWGLRTLQEVYYTEELHTLEKKVNGFTSKICLSQESTLPDQNGFQTGRITTALPPLLDLYKSQGEFYICGGKDVVAALKQYLLDAEVPSDSIFFERFT
ncbi:FAD-dependent oxidoreductase [Candidatus Roizmanbacteria bacterium]|nr:FAD-dependent oxidoreductase [Candidatus Roizmanbacteria bacterium]